MLLKIVPTPPSLKYAHTHALQSYHSAGKIMLNAVTIAPLSHYIQFKLNKLSVIFGLVTVFEEVLE